MALKNIINVAGSMGLLLTGRKMTAMAMFGKAFLELEREWRAQHPEVAETLQARWEAALSFYERTHQDPTNRLLHRLGLPMIAGGAAGLLIGGFLRPLWIASAATFSVGWALSLIGQLFFEKEGVPLDADPLSFIVGPLRDLQQQLARRRAERPSALAELAPITIDQATLN